MLHDCLIDFNVFLFLWQCKNWEYSRQSETRSIYFRHFLPGIELKFSSAKCRTFFFFFSSPNKDYIYITSTEINPELWHQSAGWGIRSQANELAQTARQTGRQRKGGVRDEEKPERKEFTSSFKRKILRFMVERGYLLYCILYHIGENLKNSTCFSLISTKSECTFISPKYLY